MKTNGALFITSLLTIALCNGHADSPLLTSEQALELIETSRAAKESQAMTTRQSLQAVPALDERVIENGERTIRVRRVAPISVESETVINEVPAGVPQNLPNPLTEALEINVEAISMAANVYGTQYSEITWRDTESQATFTVWTNVTMSYLSPITAFQDANTRYNYFGFIHSYDYDVELDRAHQAQELGLVAETRWKESPVTLSEAYYEYVVTTDSSIAVPDKLYRQLDALLGYYITNQAEFEIQHKNARTMEAAKLENLQAHPPEPVDSVTNFWPGENSVYLEKSN